MALPFFFIEEIESNKIIELKEDTSKHIVQVLRMQNGEQIKLTDGKGNIFVCEITDNHRKKCSVAIMEKSHIEQHTSQITIAISPIKNSNRFEWFLEKVTEIGVQQIIPVICERTEKTSFKIDRFKNILVSAMLQSQQCWLPFLHNPFSFKKVVDESLHQQKMIAHCTEDSKQALTENIDALLPDKLILIGPEGDFTDAEIEYALANNFKAVALGSTRLRTETAGIVAATLLCNL